MSEERSEHGETIYEIYENEILSFFYSILKYLGAIILIYSI